MFKFHSHHFYLACTIHKEKNYTPWGPRHPNKRDYPTLIAIAVMECIYNCESKFYSLQHFTCFTVDIYILGNLFLILNIPGKNKELKKKL